MANATETPAETLEAATLEARLPARDLILLGTVMRGDDASALVRLRRGQIQNVSVGDRLGQAQIVAIETGAIHLSQAGRNRRLEIPGG